MVPVRSVLLSVRKNRREYVRIARPSFVEVNRPALKYGKTRSESGLCACNGDLVNKGAPAVV